VITIIIKTTINFSIVGVPAEVQNQHLLKTCLENCRYTKLLGRRNFKRRFKYPKAALHKLVGGENVFEM
jgi:hypothetical protein